MKPVARDWKPDRDLLVAEEANPGLHKTLTWHQRLLLLELWQQLESFLNINPGLLDSIRSNIVGRQIQNAPKQHSHNSSSQSACPQGVGGCNYLIT